MAMLNYQRVIHPENHWGCPPYFPLLSRIELRILDPIPWENCETSVNSRRFVVAHP